MIVVAEVIELQKTGNGEVKALTAKVTKVEAIVASLLERVKKLKKEDLDFRERLAIFRVSSEEVSQAHISSTTLSWSTSATKSTHSILATQ